MILAVDIGNTNIVFGAFEGDTLRFTSRISTVRSRMEDEYAVTLLSVLRLNGLSEAEFDGAIISSVVPELTPVFKRAIQKVITGKVLIIGPGIKTGLDIKIDSPAGVGADLVCSAVYAKSAMPLPAIIIDMGTATKLTVLDKSGAFIGGAIVPGMKVSLDALASSTAQLPAIGIEAPKTAICNNTVDCMRSGSVFGSAAMVDGMIDRFCEELGQQASVVITGGHARHIVPLCRHQMTYNQDVMLLGLKIIYDKNS